MHLRSRVYYMQAALRSGMFTNQIFISNQDLPSSYFAERNLKRGVTLLPYWGLFRLLHQPLNVLYLLVWSHGKVFSSKVQDSKDEAGTTLVTSILVKPSAKSSMLTFIRLPVTCLLIRVLLGLMKQKIKVIIWYYVCICIISLSSKAFLKGWDLALYLLTLVKNW